MASSLSIKQLKAALDELSIDYSSCNEKRELVDLYEAARSSPKPVSDAGSQPATPASSSSDADLETNLAKLNNLLDTLPAALELLNRKWSDARSETTRSQLTSIKALLDESASAGSGNANWQAKLDDYNSFAREYKKLRDMPRNMNG